MNLIGEIVSHKKYGKGPIIDQNKTSITVRFPEEDKKFSYPHRDTFTRHLTVENKEIQDALVAEANPAQKAESDTLKRQREAWEAKQQREQLEKQRLEEQKQKEL